MTRYLLTFLSGAATTTAAVMYADGRAAFMFVVGVAFTLGGIVALLGSQSRLAHAACILSRLAGENSRTVRMPAARPMASPVKSRDAVLAPVLAVDRQVIDIQSALVNFGMTKKEALACATAAAAAGGSFEQMLARAVRSVKLAA